MKLVVGLSYAPQDNPKTQRYRDALLHAAAALEHEVELIDLYQHPSRLPEVDGVLFTGGVDIQPARYGKQSEERLCTDIDEARDQEEFRLADQAEARGLPMLGICRGAQLLNVHRGGTLLPDIETYGGMNHKKLTAEQDRRHRVKVTPGSYLSRILNSREGEINSAHHQGIERVGEGLSVSARADEDGTVEALEWADPTGKPFLLAVQWHPERMEYDERFAGRIFETFIWEVAAQKMLGSRIGTLRASREGEQPSNAGQNTMDIASPEALNASMNGHDTGSR